MTLQVELVSPERILFSGQADMVVCRTLGGGDIAFLTGHAPFVGALDIHAVAIHTSDDGVDGVEKAAVYGGFVEVKDNRVTLLSDHAELARDIDQDEAHRLREEAEHRLRESDDAAAEAQLRRAHVALDLFGQL
jgi:F-type H+-transporting ATPase subunit epsilon